jgi:DNA-directed RNA polymerase sigma subunit (sigma70/sigma32)
MMSVSSLPLFPTDDGWPYPDLTGFDQPDAAPDFDALEMLGPHAYDALTNDERNALFSHFGLHGCSPLSMKELGPALGCTRTEAADRLGRAIDKVRLQLQSE